MQQDQKVVKIMKLTNLLNKLSNFFEKLYKPGYLYLVISKFTQFRITPTSFSFPCCFFVTNVF